jgi:amino acid permease
MSDRMLSREEIMGGGLSARRAGTTVQAIRSRTAAAVAKSRRPIGGFVGSRTANAREQEFLAALAAGRDLRGKPRIQDLERHADAWESMAPSDPGLRVAVARQLLAGETVTRDRIPRMRRVLGLDELELGDVYAARLPVRERWRWIEERIGGRLERLPPFWTAFALTLTECVGAGILAIPVAMAGIGPLGSVILLAVFGLVNVVTVAALVEAITRTGSLRYGTAYFDRLVGDHLGKLGAGMMGAALFALDATVLLVALIGFAAVLEGVTGVPMELWAAVLFAVNLVLLRREKMDATIASAIVIAAVNIVLIVTLSALAMGHLRAPNFDYVKVPLLDGRPVDTDALALIFGVVLLALFGHTSAANGAKVVLQRDPSGRSLLWGNVVAMLCATVLYALTAFAFTGALNRGTLEGGAGTVLEPLAARAGPLVDVLGSLFAVLAIGLGSVYACLGLYNQVTEWRPQADPDRRFIVGSAVPCALFALMLWLTLTGRDSLEEPLGYVGTLTAPLLGGIFPMLLVVAARRRGELVPGAAPGFIGHPATAVLLGGLFLGGVVLHAVVIWDASLAQAAAAAVAVGMLAVLIVSWRRGAFRPRAVIELRREPERDLGYLGVTVAGRAVDFPIDLDGREAAMGPFESFSRLREATVQFPPDTPEEIAVWPHHVSADGESSVVPAAVANGDGRVVITLEKGGSP